jgi:ribosomal protein L25 (general stress protein Ctc)
MDKIASPCKGAVQVGSTTDQRAVWRKRGKLFTVVYDAKQRAHIFPAKRRDIAKRLHHPITAEELGAAA